MKKQTLIITIILTLMTASMIASPAMAMETFEGPDAGLFGKPTSVDTEIVVGGYNTETDNINRSKDSAFIPPPFGSLESNYLSTGELLTPGIAGVAPNPDGYHISGSTTYIPADTGGIVLPPSVAETPPVSYSSKFTLPDGLYYADGSIGTLSIPKLGMSAKVYEEESLENLAKGIGHFKSTSCWDGNVGFAAHNRNGYFGQIHTLRIGDRIIYTTKLGTRTYEVYYVGQIKETDFSRLGRTEDNLVTLITCVQDIRDMRVCVQAREIP